MLLDMQVDRNEIILMGDFDIDFMEKRSNNTVKMKELIKSYGLRQLITEPTRYSNDKNSCIDLLLTNSDRINMSMVGNLNISDHEMILMTRKKIATKKKRCNFTGRSYRNYNKNIFQQRVIQADWDIFDNSNDVKGKWEELLSIIRQQIDVMCPLKQFKIKQTKELWLSPQLIELIKDKDEALRIAKRNNDQNFWKEARTLRNRCINRLKQARADYVKENLENNRTDSKKFWQNIQNVLPNTKNAKNSNFRLLDKRENTFVDTKNTASYINDFFVNIGPNLAKNHNTRWKYYGKNIDSTLESFHTNEEDVIDICKKLNINKASCIEHLSTEILRDAFMAVPDKVCDMLNTSFNQGKIPNDWKIAKITPLKKGGNSEDVSNLRPVSLLPVISKTIEKIVHKATYNYCFENNLISTKQGGFRPNHSTISTTAIFIDEIYKAMNSNELLVATYIDAMKAFDTVDHTILLQKLKHIGIRKQAYDWFKDYLTDRYQCVRANDLISETKLITYGVPQGSVCGPLLFLIYINDLCDTMESANLSLYADDTVLYTRNSDLTTALSLMQRDLDNLDKWCSENKISINCKKSKFCIYGMRSNVKKSKSSNCILSLSNKRLERVCSYRYLGFMLDEHLNFNRHIEDLCNLASHKLYLLSCMRKYLTKDACIMIFKTMILSLIEYGDVIYTGTSKQNMTKINRLFYRGLRICNGNRTVKHTKMELCKQGKIASLDLRANAHLLLFMHKNSIKQNLLKKKVRETRLHAAPAFDLYKPNNEKAKLNVYYRGAMIWNDLPPDVRNMDFKKFKAYLNKEMKNSYI